MPNAVLIDDFELQCNTTPTLEQVMTCLFMFEYSGGLVEHVLDSETFHREHQQKLPGITSSDAW